MRYEVMEGGEAFGAELDFSRAATKDELGGVQEEAFKLVRGLRICRHKTRQISENFQSHPAGAEWYAPVTGRQSIIAICRTAIGFGRRQAKEFPGLASVSGEPPRCRYRGCGHHGRPAEEGGRLSCRRCGAPGDRARPAPAAAVFRRFSEEDSLCLL